MLLTRRALVQVKCVCDSASSGDEEMEGIDPTVVPACKCTGGRLTKTTTTEQGGVLDTGAVGAWPQNLKNHVDYIDGGSSAAYKSARTTQLSLSPPSDLSAHGHATGKAQARLSTARGPKLTEYGLPSGKLHSRFR